MFVFRKIWHALIFWNTHFEICPFALLPTLYVNFNSFFLVPLVTYKWFICSDTIMSHKSFRVNPNSIVCRDVKELIAQSRSHIWSLSDSKGIRTNNHLVCKRTLNGWVFVYELSGCRFESRCCHLCKFL